MNCQSCNKPKKDDQYPLCYNCAMAKKGTPVVSPTQNYTPKPAYVAAVKSEDRKNVSFAVSYAKDLAVAGKIGVNQIVVYAKIFEQYMDNGVIPGELPVPEEDVE